ncbi:hypothetical protein [Halospeciosus flavus]|uniref:Uncharacterized protein n=1 Tax=Halospeciosus flavus TaxID=3032283 RepID=A0ABD5Z411_9EURY|nr:hypothetical protein [Halospeciosus flavus]
MSSRPHRELVDYVEEQAGDYFRTAVAFTEEDWEIIYRREDLPRERAEQRAESVVGKARRREPLRQPDSPFGEFDAMIELYEGGVFTVIQESPSEGVIIALERDAARSLAGFILECRQTLDLE